MLDAVECHAAFAFEDEVKLGGALVVMGLGAVNIHGMGPGCRGEGLVLVADEAVAPAAGAAFTGAVAFMPNQNRAAGGGSSLGLALFLSVGCFVGHGFGRLPRMDGSC